MEKTLNSWVFIELWYFEKRVNSLGICISELFFIKKEDRKAFLGSISTNRYERERGIGAIVFSSYVWSIRRNMCRVTEMSPELLIGVLTPDLSEIHSGFTLVNLVNIWSHYYHLDWFMCVYPTLACINVLCETRPGLETQTDAFMLICLK